MRIGTAAAAAAALGAACVGCQSPMASIQGDIKRFRETAGDRIVSFQGVHRPMTMAWSGDPAKRALVFVHGSPGSWEAWARFLQDPELTSRFHVMAVDRPGFGGSGEGTSETSLRKQAEDVAAAMKANRSGLAPIYVGHSFGGPVVAAMAAYAEPKPGALVFVASSVDPALEETKWYQIPASWRLLRSLVPTPLRVCNEEILALKGELEALLPEWPKMTALALTIQGEEDDLVPPANEDFIAARYSPLRLIKRRRVPGLNHFVPWKRPDLIVEAVLQANGELESRKN